MSKVWLIQIIGSRYRCWDDFRGFGFISAGHNNPPNYLLRQLSKGDIVYAYIPNKGYVGKGTVTNTAVNPEELQLFGNFVSKDGTGQFDKISLRDAMLKHPCVFDDSGNPDICELTVGISWTKARPTDKAKRLPNMQVPQDTAVLLSDKATEEFLDQEFSD